MSAWAIAAVVAAIVAGFVVGSFAVYMALCFLMWRYRGGFG